MSRKSSTSVLLVLLQFIGIFLVLVHCQRIKWEDEIETDYSTNSNSNNDKYYNDYQNGESELRKSGKDYESEIDYKNHHSSGKSTNELVSKQYSHQFPPYPPALPSTQYTNNPGGGKPSWEWVQQPPTTTQQSRKPSFVHFPGESYPTSPPTVSAYNHGTNSNHGRRNSSTSRGSSTSSTIKINENCHCGMIPFEKDTKKMQRIVGGIVSKENSWPWMVSIAYTGQSKPFWFCGGSLISDKFVLTAAHCLRTIRNFGFSNIKLIMGTNNLNDSKSSVYYTIRAIRQHPLYKSGTEDYDVALLEIKERVNFTSKVSPICLKQEDDSYVNRTVTVAGWGSLQNGEGPPADLREVDLKVVPNDECQTEYYYNYRTSITSSMICAWLKGKDSCQGDSGGPLFLKTTSPPYAYTQIGIVSFGPPQCGKTTIPGVYSRVSSALRWIKSIAKSGTFCKGSM